MSVRSDSSSRALSGGISSVSMVVSTLTDCSVKLAVMTHPFDELSESRLRKGSGAKWNHHPAGVLPLWVTDMDFPVAEPIRQAIRDYADTDDFGYPVSDGIPGLLDSVTGHLADRHGVQYQPEDVYPTSGIIPSLFLSTLALAGPSDEVVVQPPVYPPFAMAVRNTG